jgi:hypothetical protein
MVAGFYKSRRSAIELPGDVNDSFPAMKKSIILVSALSVLMMALVSCASDSDVDPLRVRNDTTTRPAQEAAPAHESHITGM